MSNSLKAMMICSHTINSFDPNAPFLYPLKTYFQGGRGKVHWEQTGSIDKGLHTYMHN